MKMRKFYLFTRILNCFVMLASRIEELTINGWMGKTTKEMWNTVLYGNSNCSRVESLSLREIRGAFFIIVIGLLCAGVVLCFEVLYYMNKRRKQVATSWARAKYSRRYTTFDSKEQLRLPRIRSMRHSMPF